MSNKLSAILLLFMFFGITQAVYAAPGDRALGLKVGTLGAGLELTIEATDQVNVRFGGNYFKLNKQIDIEGNDYDLDVSLHSYSALADWFVSDGSFRITAGVFINKNGLTGKALARNSYEIDNTIYTSTEVGILTAKVKFRSFSPYLGIGWGNPLADDSNLSFMFDLGVVFAGKPRLDITSKGGTLSNNSILLADIVQAEQAFRDTGEVNYLKFYPVISVGLNYRF